MKIGIFSDTYFPQVSGVSTSIKTLKESLEALGHTVYVFTTTDPQTTIDDPTIIRLTSIPFTFFKDRRIAISSNVRVLKIARELELDVIHTQTEFCLGFMGKFVAKKLNIPHIHTYHTMYEDYLHYIANGKLVTPQLVEQLSRYFCNQADGVIAPSERVLNQLRGYGVQTEVRIIPTGVNLQKFKVVETERHIRQELGIKKDQPIILSLSRLSEEKNITAVIKSMPEVLNTIPNAQLVVVGDGPQREELEKLVEVLNIEKNVIFTGEKKPNEVPIYYSQSDVFVSASESESQGLTYIEALACGSSIIAKDNAYTKTLVGPNQELGRLFTDDDALAENIIEILTAPLSTTQISTVRQHVLYNISDTVFGKRAANFYQSVCQTSQIIQLDSPLKVS